MTTMGIEAEGLSLLRSHWRNSPAWRLDGISLRKLIRPGFPRAPARRFNKSRRDPGMRANRLLPLAVRQAQNDCVPPSVSELSAAT